MPFFAIKSRRDEVVHGTTGVAIATDMRRLILATALLSTVMSDDNPMDDRQEDPSRNLEDQFWSKRGKHIPRDTVRLDFDEISGTRTLVKPLKLPPLTLIRHFQNNGRYPQYDSSDATNIRHQECRIVNPSILVSLDIRDLLEERDQFSPGCNSEKCSRRGQKWQLQKPFYVDEPSWVEIENDYTDGVSHYLDPNDPFVLSRGKKIYRFKDNAEGTDERSTVDYDEFQNNREKSRKSTKRWSGSRGSMRWDNFVRKRNDGEAQDLKAKDEIATPELRKGYSYTRDLGRYEDPFIFTRGKKMHSENDVQRNDNSESYFNDRERNEIFVTRNVKRGKRSLSRFEPEDLNAEGNNFNRTKNESLPRDKILRTSLDDRSVRSSNSTGKLAVKYPDSKAEVNKFINNKETDKDEPLLINSRVRRNSYNDPSDSDESTIDKKTVEEYNKGRENDDKEIAGTKYLERRSENSGILDLLEQPFFISRGKKSRNSETIFPINGEMEELEDNNLIENLMDKQILSRLMENLKCGSEECSSGFNEIVKRKTPRDRRGGLDELLAKYDPFYVARGKRMTLDNSFAKLRSILDTEIDSMKPSKGKLDSEFNIEIM